MVLGGDGFRIRRRHGGLLGMARWTVLVLIGVVVVVVVVGRWIHTDNHDDRGCCFLVGVRIAAMVRRLGRFWKADNRDVIRGPILPTYYVDYLA